MIAKLLVVAILVFTQMGCASDHMSRQKILGSPGKIEMYSGGKKIREWTSIGKVIRSVDTYYFQTPEGISIEVSGDLVITRIDSEE